MSRSEDLRNVFKDIDEGKRKVIDNLIDEAVFLETQMQELKKHPFIKFHPQNPNLQKITAAGKQYREFLQTYTNIIDKLARILGKEADGEQASPLRVYFERLQKEVDE